MIKILHLKLVIDQVNIFLHVIIKMNLMIGLIKLHNKLNYHNQKQIKNLKFKQLYLQQLIFQLEKYHLNYIKEIIIQVLIKSIYYFYLN